MKSSECDMRRSAVQVITVLSGLLITVTGATVYLVSNEFEAGHQLNEMRVKLNEFQQGSEKSANELASRDSELVRLRVKLQQTDSIHETNLLVSGQNRDELLDRVNSAEVEAVRARKAVDTAQGELRHAIEQSRKLEENLKTRLARAEKGKADVQNSDGQEAIDITALKQQLNTTLQQLAAAKDELLALRSDALKKKHPTVTAPPLIPAPVTKLSSPPRPQSLKAPIFGQIKAVETANQFVVIQLNSTKGVLGGDSLAVTRHGIPVGILRVYRVGPQSVVFTTLTPDLRDKVRIGDQVILQK